MSQYTRYIVLIMILVVFLLVVVVGPKITGNIIAPTYNDVSDCSKSTEYYGCVKCCEKVATGSHGAEYYGTKDWNKEYNSCWSMNCEKFAEKHVLVKRIGTE